MPVFDVDWGREPMVIFDGSDGVVMRPDGVIECSFSGSVVLQISPGAIIEGRAATGAYEGQTITFNNYDFLKDFIANGHADASEYITIGDGMPNLTTTAGTGNFTFNVEEALIAPASDEFTWTTEDGQIIPISKLEDSHLANIIKMLSRNMVGLDEHSSTYQRNESTLIRMRIERDRRKQ